MKKEDVLIVCALELETQGEIDDYNVLYTGVGKVNATFGLSNYLAMSDNETLPKLIINFGTAGSRDLKIGDLIDCKKFLQRDMNCVPLGFQHGQTPYEDDVPIMLEFPNVKFNPVNKHFRGWGFICGSGDNFVTNMNKEIDSVEVFDMEAYSLAKVCHLYEIEFISFKYITDNVNGKSPDDWVTNCKNGAIKFKEEVLGELE
jgi:adenosylhomocysteine nucleosidase|tara:strand:- start:984 stop:1589 length:606 start_codon:yes stop_codon:yes gene_type:complete